MTVKVIITRQFFEPSLSRIFHVKDEPEFSEARARVLVGRGFARWDGDPPPDVVLPPDTNAALASWDTAPDWFLDWRGQPCVIVASGPSAAEAGVERARGRAKFVAVNDSWKLVPWADALYATDYRWWDKFEGLPEFSGMKICQDPKITTRPEWGVHKVDVSKRHDQLIVAQLGLIGWGGNSGFGALNLAVQFGANPIVLVGYDMRLDLGVHWHGLHGRGLTNPHARNVERWRRCVDGCAPLLTGLGIRVFNASPVSWLKNYPKMDLMEALDERTDCAA